MKKWVGICLVFAAGCALGAGIALFSAGPQKTTGPKERAAISTGISELREADGSAGYHFTNPLLACDTIENIPPPKIQDLKDKISQFAGDEKQQGLINSYAVYFREMNNGPWFGINEQTPFLPASLLKVPLMISIYKKAESDPKFLERKILVNKIDTTYQDLVPAKEQIQAGKTYSIEELVESTIKNSDNGAALLLAQIISRDELNESYSALGINVPGTNDYTISAKAYGSFFRILYNATYVSRTYSEQALSLLSETTFDQALDAGVPPETVVAHKYGDRLIETGEKQLHDCGIVYYPKHHYLLCVMSRGSDIPTLESFIKNISRMTYQEVSAM